MASAGFLRTGPAAKSLVQPSWQDKASARRGQDTSILPATSPAVDREPPHLLGCLPQHGEHRGPGGETCSAERMRHNPVSQ